MIYTPQPRTVTNLDIAHVYPPADSSASKIRPTSLGQGHEDSKATGSVNVEVYSRPVTRTPSPTPFEQEALSTKIRSCSLSYFKRYISWWWLKNPKNLAALVATLIILTGVIAFFALQKQLVYAMLPAFEWLRKTPGAWLIPIGIMIVLSCPPLFGHEFVAILCGDIWGVWIGFGIVTAGTVFGELFTYYVFRFGCRARGEKMEVKNLKYALICEVIREGGLPMAVIVRFSTIPPHLTTALFATAGMHVTTFLMAALLALPKQLAIVYVGVADGNSSGAPADENLGQKTFTIAVIVKVVVAIVTVVITVYAMRYIDQKMNIVKERVIYARRKARSKNALTDANLEESETRSPS